MARTITFALDGHEFSVEPMKIDRRKVYGFSEIHAFDDEGNECQLVSTDATGTIIIPKGGITLGVTSPDGMWVERSELKVVGPDGDEVEITKSSYSGVNELTRKVSDEEFLDCSITAMYHLADASPDLVKALGEDIYAFDYCYLDSYETSPGFVMAAEVDSAMEVFMFVGKLNEFTYVGFQELAIADDDVDSESEESDEIDFSMF